MNARMKSYCQLMRCNKPIGSLLLLWPTLWALWIAAHGVPNLFILTIFVLGVFVMRSAGCVINDIADRNFDGAVIRTKTRPLVTHAVTVNEAFVLFAFLCLIALLLVMQLNLLTRLLAVWGIVLAISYPFAKRITH